MSMKLQLQRKILSVELYFDSEFKELFTGDAVGSNSSEHNAGYMGKWYNTAKENM